MSDAKTTWPHEYSKHRAAANGVPKAVEAPPPLPNYPMDGRVTRAAVEHLRALVRICYPGKSDHLIDNTTKLLARRAIDHIDRFGR